MCACVRPMAKPSMNESANAVLQDAVSLSARVHNISISGFLDRSGLRAGRNASAPYLCRSGLKILRFSKFRSALFAGSPATYENEPDKLSLSPFPSSTPPHLRQLEDKFHTTPPSFGPTRQFSLLVGRPSPPIKSPLTPRRIPPWAQPAKFPRSPSPNLNYNFFKIKTYFAIFFMVFESFFHLALQCAFNCVTNTGLPKNDEISETTVQNLFCLLH